MDQRNKTGELKARLYRFTLRLIALIDVLPGGVVGHRIGDQLLRSGTSILANYVEGQSAASRREFTNFLRIALKSANESKVWLCLLRDSKRVSDGQSEWLLKELGEISSILASSVITLKRKQ